MPILSLLQLVEERQRNKWKGLSLAEMAAIHARTVERQRQQMQKAVSQGRRIAEQRSRDYTTESNDNAWSDYSYTGSPRKARNRHLAQRVEEGAKAHAAWVREHPIMSAWGNVAGAVPFAVAAVPFGAGAIAAGDAAAATAGGKAVTGLLTAAASSPVGQGAKSFLPWLDAMLTAGAGAHGVRTAIDEGGMSPTTALEVAPLGRVARPAGRMVAQAVEGARFPLRKPATPNVFYDAYNQKAILSEQAMSEETPAIGWAEAQKIKPFQSELDWTPEGWFGTRATGTYDAEDVAALQSHLPEYLEIERIAKANGTWLKMPDGSIWQGDPRSWVQLMSKEGQKLSPERLFTGMSMDKARNPLYTGNVWADKERKVSSFWAGEDSAYPGKVLEVAPAKGSRLTFDAQGHYWNDLPKEQDGIALPPTEGWDGRTITDGAAEYAANKGYGITQINNVREGSGDLVTDVVIHKGFPRKSLLGNNGNFDFSNPNIYKGLFPFVLGSGLYGVPQN